MGLSTRPCILLALLLLLPSAPGAPAAEASATLPGGAWMEVRADGSTTRPGPLSPAEAWASPGVDLRDPATYPEAVRAFLASRGHAAGLAATAQASGHHLAIAAGGDLDGDGRADAYHVALQDGISLAARRGHDASLLWRFATDAPSLLYLVLPDVTGDARPDVLLGEVRAEGRWSCAPGLCAEVAAYSWDIRLLSGADGATVWSRAFRGEATWTRAQPHHPNVLAYAVLEDATNVFVLPIPGGDMSGDGLPDLTLNAFDVRNAYAVAAAPAVAAGAWAYDFASRAEALRGADGAVLYGRVATASFPSYLEPVGDAVGDARHDAAWVTSHDAPGAFACALACASTPAGPERHALDLVDSATGQTAWTRALDPPGFAWPMGADVTGDGAADLLVLADGDGGRVWVALSGADGAAPWEAPVRGLPLGVLPRAGAPGADLLVVDAVLDAEAARLGARLDRVDGATGGLLRRGEWSWPSSASAAYLRGFRPGDLTGDGQDDVALDLVALGSVMTSRALALDAATGDMLHALETAGLAFQVPAGEITGDGAADLLLVRFDTSRWTSSVEARAGATGATLWSRPAAPLAWVEPAGDLTGDGRDDLLSVHLADEGWRADAVDGASGATVWRLPDALTPRGA
ncbi:MAG TPA: hypothetical protein VNX21_03520 [Candidatus Thermoplasmatota archaeon]|nr:hypothetical protein [Candidatus Thermoplasmatota archaeon]